MIDPASALKEVAGSSSEISAWALAVVGGTVVAVLNTSYRRPDQVRYRLPFMLFLPGWVLNAVSLYAGNTLRGKYLAALMVNAETAAQISSDINNLYTLQRTTMLWSLACFGLWLVIF